MWNEFVVLCLFHVGGARGSRDFHGALLIARLPSSATFVACIPVMALLELHLPPRIWS